MYLYGFFLFLVREVFFYNLFEELFYAIDLGFFFIYANNLNTRFFKFNYCYYYDFICMCILFYLFFLYVHFSCICICISHSCLVPEEEVRSPKTDITVACESSYGCLELNPDPLAEQSVHLTIRPSLQLQNVASLWCPTVLACSFLMFEKFFIFIPLSLSSDILSSIRPFYL